MLINSMTQQAIDNIRNEKLNLKPNSEITERIKLLQREMVKLSFQKNRKDDISLIVNEIARLRKFLNQ
jgi:uncharacterized small protein (DUF1192 family)